ncbi:hypothetical protein D0962_23080 [Leptolyngbyaceae cyanobacterium CCMR0082]|uniref:Actin-like protein N-terminal domain-containing protein n=1 Tax=Adonisia turfae CCMR0082 TaxID=2304604 RepID=A0A6M0SAW5_9CYAN|nr:hypothetical protein [Adonisia turfae]NEZ65604.1 hypothetical protein [Adonisia turfae CCMR0082]
MANQSGKEFNSLVLDVGNSDLKGYINGQFFCLPSSYVLSFGLDSLDLMGVKAPFDGFSVYDHNNNPEHKQYKFAKLGGNRVLGDGDKLQMYKVIVQGCCGSRKSDKPWKVVISHWSRGKMGDMKKILKGTHVVTVNGVQSEFKIAEVVPVNEAAGADLLYRQKASGSLAVIDIGYNTLIYRQTSEAGVEHHSVFRNYGVRQIVMTIKDSNALRALAGCTPDARAIIRAIQNHGMLRSNQVEKPEVDISHIISAAVRDWASGPLGEVTKRFSSGIGQSSGIWLIGGGANLLRKYAEGTNIHVPEEPEYVNVRGMATLLNANEK